MTSLSPQKESHPSSDGQILTDIASLNFTVLCYNKSSLLYYINITALMTSQGVIPMG